MLQAASIVQLVNSVPQALQHATTVVLVRIQAKARQVVRNAQWVTLPQIKPQLMHAQSVYSTSIRIKKDNQIVLHALLDALPQLKVQITPHCVYLLKQTFIQGLLFSVLSYRYSWNMLYTVDITALRFSGSRG